MLEKWIDELKTKFSFKHTTGVNDVVIVLSEGFGIIPDQINFAFVKSINPAPKNNFKVELLLLGPFRTVAFNLIKEFFTGNQFFYVDGNKMWICAIDKVLSKGEDPSDENKQKVFQLIHGGNSEKNS